LDIVALGDANQVIANFRQAPLRTSYKSAGSHHITVQSPSHMPKTQRFLLTTTTL